MNPTIQTGAIILGTMWLIHMYQGERLAAPDVLGLAAGTGVAWWWMGR